jgi:hypothetical protein
MLIRKNTKQYKAINNIFRYHANKTTSLRQKNIQLYIVENGKTLADKIAVSTLEENKDVFYEMTYGTILNSFGQPNYQLFQSEDSTNLYFFKNTNNRDWDQTPFELSKNLQAKMLEFVNIIIEPPKADVSPKATEPKPNKSPKPVEKDPIKASDDEAKKAWDPSPEKTDDGAKQEPKVPIKEQRKEPNKEIDKAKKGPPSPPIEPPKKVKEDKQKEVDFRSKEWLKVGSEGIEAFNYLIEREMLFIIYRPDSACYVYYDVSKAQFSEILSQKHMATFVNRKFKGNHDYDFVGKVII